MSPPNRCSLCLLASLPYRYDDGSTDQLKDDWESEDGVIVFSPGDDAMGFSIQLMVDDLEMQILTFDYILPRQAPVHNLYFAALYIIFVH